MTILPDPAKWSREQYAETANYALSAYFPLTAMRGKRILIAWKRGDASRDGDQNDRAPAL